MQPSVGPRVVQAIIHGHLISTSRLEATTLPVLAGSVLALAMTVCLDVIALVLFKALQILVVDIFLRAVVLIVVLVLQVVVMAPVILVLRLRLVRVVFSVLFLRAADAFLQLLVVGLLVSGAFPFLIFLLLILPAFLHLSILILLSLFLAVLVLLIVPRLAVSSLAPPLPL